MAEYRAQGDRNGNGQVLNNRPEIFEANKDIIENPNLIRPGWKLRIP
jgi:nucleoid-associated protein YgaU